MAKAKSLWDIPDRPLYVGSTPFVPAGWEGTIRISHVPVGHIVRLLNVARQDGRRIISFCGHPASADYLVVPCNRGEADLKPGQTWVGIRPTRRPKPGEELVPPRDFIGWMMEVLS